MWHHGTKAQTCLFIKSTSVLTATSCSVSRKAYTCVGKSTNDRPINNPSTNKVMESFASLLYGNAFHGYLHTREPPREWSIGSLRPWRWSRSTRANFETNVRQQVEFASLTKQRRTRRCFHLNATISSESIVNNRLFFSQQHPLSPCLSPWLNQTRRDDRPGSRSRDVIKLFRCYRGVSFPSFIDFLHARLDGCSPSRGVVFIDRKKKKLTNASNTSVSSSRCIVHGESATSRRSFLPLKINRRINHYSGTSSRSQWARLSIFAVFLRSILRGDFIPMEFHWLSFSRDDRVYFYPRRGKASFINHRY